MSILVIDDENVTRRVVIHALRSMDVSVLEAEDGTGALEIAQNNSISLAIVDINLPDIDGFEVMRQLQALPGMAGTPIIMFTARNRTGDEMMAREVGAVDFLYKPFSTQELRELVMKHLQ